MSLKWFHVLFIMTSILVLLGFGYWAVDHFFKMHTVGYLITAIVCFFLALSLGVYVSRFSRKN